MVMDLFYRIHPESCDHAFVLADWQLDGSDGCLEVLGALESRVIRNLVGFW